MVNEKTISFRIKPYAQEATLQAGIDIIVIVLTTSVLLVAKFPLIICVSVAIGYLVLAFTLHYRVLIQAFVDKRKGDFITETVSVKCFAEEHSFAGNSLGHSYISTFYSKEMHVQKYRLNVVNSHGDEKKLRSVMSFRRLLQFAVLDKQQVEHLQIIYLKRSKILLWCNLIEETDKKLSKRKKEAISKAIHFINMSV